MTVSKYGEKHWQYRIRYKDHNGKWREQKRVGFEKRKDAVDAEAKAILANKNPITNDITFGELYTEYIEYSSGRLKETTVQTTRYKIERHVLPHFKDRKINKITVRDVKKWQDVMNEQKYSTRYKRGIFNCLTKVLNYGVKFYDIPANVAIKNGNFENKGELKKEMKIWTLTEFEQFIAVIPDDDVSLIYKTFYIVMYWTGTRRGELQALTWNDVFNDFGSIKINKTCSCKIKGKPYVITPPKTKTAIRSISLPDPAKNALAHLYNQEMQRAGFTKDMFVFGLNTPLSDTTIEARKNRYCDEAKVKRIRIHDFRHSHASILISRGNTIVQVAHRLGHSDISMTLNTYSHLMPNSDDILVKNLNDLATNLPRK